MITNETTCQQLLERLRIPAKLMLGDDLFQRIVAVQLTKSDRELLCDVQIKHPPGSYTAMEMRRFKMMDGKWFFLEK